MLSSIINNLLWSQAPNLVFFIALAGVLGWLIYRPILYGALLIFLACFFFFRNPERICAQAMLDPLVAIAPADGHIVDIQHDPHGLQGYHHKISIFLSPLDVHVNWTPIAGTITSLTHVGGKFLPAFLPKSSELNEHNDVIIRHASGKTVLVRQIAGTMARRICCWLHVDQKVPAGFKYGMIKFSSRVDLFLPAGSRIDVKKGQAVTGGCTVLGRLGE